MSMVKMSKIVCLCLVIIVLLALGSTKVGAQAGYPRPVDKYVNDYAEVLESKDEQTLRARLYDLDTYRGIEVTILTIDSIRDYDTGDETIESFATNLFNVWGIGDKERNEGVLILVAKSDQKIRIELGRGYGSGVNQAMQRVIDEKMVPHFRQADYSRGVIAGTEAVIDVIAESNEVPSGGSQYKVRDAWLGLLVGLIVGGFMLRVAYAISKRSAAKRVGRSKKRRSRGRNTSEHWRDWHGRGGSFGGSDSFGGGSSAGDGASGEW
jgi:uncharacterized protein